MSGPPGSGKTMLARVAGTLSFPSNFSLVAAMNPCPCGYFGDPRRSCSCAASAVARYQKHPCASVEGQERVRAAYGANSDRLVALKNRYDPTNLFRLNQNVLPTV